MILKFINKTNFIYFSVIFISIFSFTFFQSESQHWSSIFYFDLTIIYNSLQVVSGEYQEYRDHPGFTQFFLNGLFFKFFSFLDADIPSNLYQYLNSENKNTSIQKLYLITRYLHSFFYFCLSIYFFKILRFFNIHKLYIFVFIALFFSLNALIYDLTVMRPDVLCLLFFFMSFYYLLIFFSRKNFLFLFLSSLFLFLSLMSKIQGIFFIPVILFFTLNKIYILNEGDLKLFSNKFTLKSIYQIIILFFVFSLYFLIQVQLQNYPRFSNSNFIDLKIIIFFLIFLFIFINFIFKNNYKKKFFLNIFFIYLSFFFITILIFLLISVLDIVKLSPYALLRLTNPFSYMSLYAGNLGTSNSFLLDLFYKFFSLETLRFNMNLFYLFHILFISSFIINYYRHKTINFFNLFLYFFFIFFIFSFNLRYYFTYGIYSFSLFFLTCALFLHAIHLSKVKYFFITLIIILTIIPTENKFLNSSILSNNNFYNDYFERENNIKLICQTKKHRFMYWWWANNQDEVFWKSICEQQGYELLETDIIIKDIY